MSLTRISAVVALMVAGPVASAWGQNPADQGAVIVPINNWSYQRHASTATEGYLNGSARVIQAAGQKNYLDSVAAINGQTAYTKALNNSKLYVKTYFERKEINRQYRDKYDSVPPTKEQWARITKAWLPDRLTPEQYDVATGKLIWPHVLRTEQYAPFRDRIDVLMSQRTPDNSGDGSPSQLDIDELVEGMKMVLLSNIDNMSSSQYASAKWFLLSVEYEAKMPLTATTDVKTEPDA